MSGLHLGDALSAETMGVLNSLAVGVLIRDVNGRLVFANSAVEQILGVKAKADGQRPERPGSAEADGAGRTAAQPQ